MTINTLIKITKCLWKIYVRLSNNLTAQSFTGVTEASECFQMIQNEENHCGSALNRRKYLE